MLRVLILTVAILGVHKLFPVNSSNAANDLFLSLGAAGAREYYTADGTLWNRNPAPAHGCLTDTETLPQSIGPDTQASGNVVFDIPPTDGILAYSGGPSGGWEYPLSKK